MARSASSAFPRDCSRAYILASFSRPPRSDSSYIRDASMRPVSTMIASSSGAKLAKREASFLGWAFVGSGRLFRWSFGSELASFWRLEKATGIFGTS